MNCPYCGKKKKKSHHVTCGDYLCSKRRGADKVRKNRCLAKYGLLPPKSWRKCVLCGYQFPVFSYYGAKDLTCRNWQEGSTCDKIMRKSSKNGKLPIQKRTFDRTEICYRNGMQCTNYLSKCFSGLTFEPICTKKGENYSERKIDYPNRPAAINLMRAEEL